MPMTAPGSAASNPRRVSRSARQAALPVRSSRVYGAASVRVVRRVPDPGVEAVEDADEPVALGTQGAVEPHPEGGRQGLGREPGRDRVDQVGALDPLQQQIEPVGAPRHDPVTGCEPELRQLAPGRPTVVGEVMERQQHRGTRDDRVVRVADVAIDGRGTRVPVVGMHDVDRAAVRAERLEGRPTEQAEAPRIVRVVARRVAIEALAIEGGRVVDEAQPVAVRGDVDDGHGAVARWRPSIRDAQAGGAFDGRGLRHATVARQEHVDRRVDLATQLAERSRQRVDDIREAAGLRPRFALGGEHRDTQRHGRHRTRRPGRAPSRRHVSDPAPAPKPVHVRYRPGMMPPHGPSRNPVHPGRELPAPTASRRAAASRLQPPLGLASPYARPVQPDRPHGVDPVSEPDPGHQRRDRMVAPARRRQVPGRIPRRAGRVRRLHGQWRGPLVPAPLRRRARRPDRVLLRRVRVPRIARDLLRRPRGAGGRPHEDGQRHGPAGARCRAALPQGLLPTGDRCRRPPGTRLPGLRPEPAAARARAGRVGPAADGHRWSCPDETCRSRCGSRRSAASRSCSSTRTCPENADSDRPITNILYVRGREMRLHQELVLGIGGVRAIRALGLSPAVWHLNEGHSAFLLAERAREYVAAGRNLAKAWEDVRRDSVFTIHTPVSAGNERFDTELVRRVAGPLLDAGGVPVDDVLESGARRRRGSRPVRHDGLLAAADPRRERSQPSPCRDRRTRPGAR